MPLDQHLVDLRNSGLQLIQGVTAARQAPEIHVDLQGLRHLPAGTLAFYDLASFDDEDFVFTVPDERPRLEQLRAPRPPETTDLRRVDPALTRFESHVGEDAVLTVTVPWHGALITCLLTAPWYTEFVQVCEAAEAQAAAQAHEAREAQVARDSEALEEHARKLRIIVDDAAFLKLARVKSTSLRTLVAYVASQQPAAVTALGEQRTRDLVRELRDHVMFGQSL
ncbi:hypothetical protein K7W42_18625 [Deinococcus sp. HMF7604]|uniref:hypothetical protein n=1 Tax=Deinococcus betulae TaxID=2873312 RepID=UPI001CCA7F84|nr:hypothetical protein [Deinococcus betulae]MBZ9752859.1 hypothetical protein [Deinococcus betulae]